MSEDEIFSQDMLSAALTNIRPVQGHWTWRDKTLGPGREKTVEERMGVLTVLQAYGLRVEQMHSGDDPPDCQAIIDGELWGIEVTELVDQPWLSRAIKHKRNGQPLPDPFNWSKEVFLSRLQERITEKDDAARRYMSRYPRCVLVIVTAESDLQSHAVHHFLRGATFRAARVTDVFLGLDYHASPDGNGRHPVFKLPLTAP